MTGEADVAVVVVATDEGPLLLNALESLRASPPRRLGEVLVVDNASGDDGPDEASRQWGPYASCGTRFAGGCHTTSTPGIAATTAPYVMVCNPDIVFLPGAVDALVAFPDERHRAAVAGPRLLSPRGGTWRSARRWYDMRSLLALRWPGTIDPQASGWARRSFYPEWDFATPRVVDWVPCMATMLCRWALAQIGGFDEAFRAYFDDVDLALRLAEAGWEVCCVPDAEVVHFGRLASRTPLSRAWFLHLGSLVRFVWKHRGLAPRSHESHDGKDRPPEATRHTCRDAWAASP